MRPRDFGRVASATHDVLVIGGGVHGLMIAYETASRGLHTALVERGDFGAASSFNHQKTVHGGLRSLQSAAIWRARRAIRERRALARMAPWLLRPLPFLVGTYRSVTRGRPALRAAFAIDAWIARDRNEGVEPELHLPAARLISKAATLRLFPGVRREGLTGGAQWYDYQMVESERLTIAVAAAADNAGADVVNYAEAVAAIREHGRLAGMRVRDRLTGEEAEMKARLVVNAAGAAAGRVMRMFGVDRPYPVIKAMNLVARRAVSEIALAAPDREGRMLTVVPWRGRAIIGTSQSAATVEPDETAVRSTEVDAFVAQANSAFPALNLRRGDITLVHRGNVPAVVDRRGGVDLLGASRVVDHDREGAPGGLTVVGAKYTTARGVASDVAALAARKLRRRIQPSRSDSTSLPGAGMADHEALAIVAARSHAMDVPAALLQTLVERYAEHAARIVGLMAGEPGLREPLPADRPAVAAEVSYAIRHEMAVHLPDIVIRRLGLGAGGHPGEATVRAAASIAAPELGWDANAVRSEIEQVGRFYDVAE